MIKGQPDPSNSGTVVSFADDANVVVSTPPSVSFDSDLLLQNYPDVSLLDFLARPVKWKQGTFSLTDTLNKPEFSIGTTLSGILSDIPMWKEKLRGYYGIRYDLELRLVLNANAHQQGLYRLCAIPVGDCVSGLDAVNWTVAHTSTKLQRSMIPGVFVNLSEDTEVVLNVPYCSKRLFSLLSSIAPYQQIIRLYPFSILQAGSGANNCSWTLFASLKNVSLYGQAVPESVIDVEQRRGKIGPIGSMLRKISSASRTLSAVPTLTSVAAPVAWASDLASQVAYVFGWSRPTDLSTYNNHVRSIMPGFSNYDVPDRSKQLAPMARNQLQLSPSAFGSDEDEMDFRHFLSRYCYVTQFSWNLANVVDTQVYAVPLAPSSFRFAASAYIMHHSPVSLLGSMFQLYRGSFAFRLTFIKTKFHSGRLEVVFHPAHANVPPIMAQDSPWVQKTIIDVRERSSFIFEVPWISPQSFLHTEQYYGWLQINIVEELSCPDTVSSSIEVMVEVCGCEDFEFAEPSPPSHIVPYFDVVPQSGLGSGKVNYSNKHLATAIGETVRSFRQLLKIPSYFDVTTPKTGWTSVGIVPFMTQYPTRASGGLPNSTCDTYGVLSSLFLFSSGSVRFKAYNSLDPDYIIEAVATRSVASATSSFALIQNPSLGEYANSNVAWRYNSPIAVCASSEGVEVQVPQYGFNRVRNSIDTMSTTPTSATPSNYQWNDVSPLYVVLSVDSTKNLNNLKIYRCGGDDSNFGTFVSIPPMTVPGYN